MLDAVGYTDEAVAEPVRRHRFLLGTETNVVGELDEPLAALVELFALGQRVRSARARAALEPVDLGEISETGLVTVNGEWVTPRYRLQPYADLLLAADVNRPGDPDRVSSFTGHTLKLARLTPRGRARSMLDVGAGSGILALLGATHSDRVTATDVNPRALMFAGFNASLNEITNLELLEGPWFEPVAGRVFDLIVCNPPYVVSPDQEFAYRDSGLPGSALLEQLTRGMADGLAPGGLAVMLCNWPHDSEDDWDAAPTAAAAGTGCDALILGAGTVDPFEYVVRWSTPPVEFMEPGALRETVARWLGYYQATGVGAITNGAVILRRRTRGTPWLRTMTATATVGDRASEQLTALLAGHDLLEQLELRGLLARRFSLPEGLDISQRFQRRDARFTARPAMIRLDDGLGVSAAVDPDALDVLFACDGRRTLSEAVDHVATRRGVSAEAVSETAIAAVSELLRHGLLQGT